MTASVSSPPATAPPTLVPTATGSVRADASLMRIRLGTREFA